MPREKVDLLIENAVVLTVALEQPIVWNGAIAVKGRTIEEVGPTVDLQRKYEANRTIDGSNKLATPGLINAHTHTTGALSRGLINDLSFFDWLDKKRFLAANALDEDSYYASTMLLCAEMLRSGTTCFVDCGTMPQLEEVAVRAIEKIGIKAVLGRMLADERPESPSQQLAESEEFVRKYHGAADTRIQTWLSPQQASWVSDELTLGARRLAEKYAVGVCPHASVTKEDVERCVGLFNTTPVKRMHDLGCTGPNFLIAHGGWVTDDEIQILKETGSTVAHCPGASMKCAYGSLSHGKIPEMLQAGVTVGLASDGPSASSFQDMVRVMHLAASGHKEARLDASLIHPEDAVGMATVNNARAVLWGDQTGSIQAGRRADLVLFDLLRPEWAPWNEKNVVSNLVYSASGSSVDTVIVDGKTVVEGGNLQTVDEREVIEDAQRHSKRFVELSIEWEATRGRA